MLSGRLRLCLALPVREADRRETPEETMNRRVLA